MQPILFVLVGDSLNSLIDEISLYITTDQGNCAEQFDCLYYNSCNEKSAFYGTNNTLRYEVKNEAKSEYFANTFQDIHNKLINADSDSTCLSVYFILQSYKLENWHRIQEQLVGIDLLHERYSLNFCTDFILLGDDLSYLFEQKDTIVINQKTFHEASISTIEAIQALMSGSNCEHHAILVQNRNMNGIAINFQIPSLAQFLGEFAIQSIFNYDKIFLNSIPRERNFYGLGLSTISFNKKTANEYLTHLSIVSLLERENILQESVDINKIAPIFREIMEQKHSLFTRLWNKYRREFNTSKNDQDSIVTNINNEFSAEIKDIKAQYLDFINNQDLSIPEKEATFALLLEADSNLLDKTYILDKSLPSINACFSDALNYFIDLDKELSKAGGEFTEYCSLFNNGFNTNTLDANTLINELHSSQLAITKTGTYLQIQEQQLNELSNQIENHATNNDSSTSDYSLQADKNKAELLQKQFMDTQQRRSSQIDKYAQNRIDLDSLLVTLQNPAIRDQLTKGAKALITHKIMKLKQDVEKINECIQGIRDFRRKQKLRLIKVFTLTWAACVAIYVFFFYILNMGIYTVFCQFDSLYGYIAIGLSFILFSYLLFMNNHIQSQQIDIKNREIELKQKTIENYNNQFNQANIKSHIAGQVIDEAKNILNSLKTNYSKICYFHNTLSKVFEKENDWLASHKLTNQFFISLLTTDDLNRYYQEHIKKQIFLEPDFWFYKFLMKDKATDTTNIIKYITQELTPCFNNKFDNFNIFDYLINDATYPFLKSIDKEEVKKTVISLVNHAKVTLVKKNNGCISESYSRKIFFCCPPGTSKEILRSKFSVFFTEPPIFEDTNSDSKMTLLQIDALLPSELGILPENKT